MSASDKPRPAVKARLPRGLVDRSAADVAATDAMLAKIRERFELFGFEPVETPMIEFTDALGKFLPDQDRPNEGVFSFLDDDEQWLSLRYDLTAPLARHVAEHFDALPKPYRSYRCGYVFRNEKPGPGRFRQFMQFDADIVGAAGVAADAEACMLMADTLEAVGIARGDYVIKVNSRRLLDGVLEAIGLGGDENAVRRLGVLRAIDKLDKFGPDGVALLLGPGRKDESGDFTKGVGLDDRSVARVLAALVAVEDIAAADPTPTGSEAIGRQDLADLEGLVRAAGYGPDRIRIDPSIVRGLEYYTGMVFEAELTFPVTNEEGQVVRFGSVAGGGRYDGLVGRFRAEPVPATGFSIGVSRLHAALKLTGSPLVTGAAKRGPVVVTVMDRDRMADYQRMVSALRGAGIAAEIYLGSSGFNAQMKYADRRHSPCAVIQGGDEKAAGTVQIKDLVLGGELARLGREGKDRADYLARQAQAQFAVADTDEALVAAVRQVLARHAG